MPQFEPTGVTLVAENANEYLRTLDQARRATEDFGASAGGQAASGVEGLTVGTIALGSALGMLASQALMAATNAINNFIQSGIQATAFLEDVRIKIETMTASELIMADTTKTMTEALAESGPISDMVMEKLQKLSLTSPFEYRQILDVYTMNKAFGQSTEMSLELTRAITNLGSVNKQIPGIMQRLSYNFSQMSMVGKITARDMRDLSMAGLDLKKVLQLQLGKSIQEVNKDLESGKLTFEDVSKALVDYVDKYIGPAAERAARTFNGLISSFHDLQFFAATDVFGPAMKLVTENMGNFFDKLQAFIQSGGLKPLGAGLELVTQSLFDMANQAANAGKAFFDQFGSQIMAAIDSAFEWGWNLITQFATGIMQGAAEALAAAMNVVSDMLSYFLAPGSPPRVTPNIDKWGTAAMTEYLKGFTEADFSALSASESGIKQALSALVSAGDISKDDENSIFKAISGDIVKAIGAGGDVTNVIASIRSQLGMYGAEVADLVAKQVALAIATDKVTAAQEALKKAQEDEAKAQADVIKFMDEYNALAAQGASPEVLAAKRKEFEDAKKRRELAYKAGKDAADQLTTSQEEIDTLKKKAGLQNNVLDQLVDLTKETQNLAKAAAKGGGKGAAGAKPAEVAKKMMEQMKKNVSDQMEKMKETIKAKVGEAFKPIQDAWNNAMAILAPAWARFSSTFYGIYKKYIEPAAIFLRDKVFTPEFIKKAGEVIGWVIGVRIVFAGLFTVLDVIAVLLSPAGKLLSGLSLLGQFFAAIYKAITGEALISSLAAAGVSIGGIALAIGAIIAVGTLFYLAWTNNWLGIRDTLTSVWQSTIKPALEDLWAWLQINIPIAIQTLTDFWNNTLWPAMQAVWGWVSTVLFPILQEVWNWLATNIPAAITTLVGFWNGTLWPAFQGFWAFLNDVWFPLFKAIGEFIATVFVANFQVAVAFFNATFRPVLEGIWSFISTSLFPIFKDIGAFIGGLFVQNLDAAKEQVKTLWTWLQSLWDILNTSVFPIIRDVAGFIRDVFVQAVKDLTKAFEDATTWVNNIKDALLNLKLPDWLTPGSPTPLETGVLGLTTAFSNLVQNIPATLGSGFSETLMTAVGQIGNFINNVLIPAFTGVATYISITLPAAFLGFSIAITNLLITPLQNFIIFLSEIVIVALQGLNNIFSVDGVNALTLFTDSLNNGVYAGFVALTGHLTAMFFPNILVIYKFLVEQFKPLLEYLGWYIQDKMIGAFVGWKDAANEAADAIMNLVHAIRILNSLQGPSTPGSPTPYEIGFRGIIAAVDLLANRSIPQMTRAMDQMPSTRRAFGADASMSRMQLASSSQPVVVEKTVNNLTLNSRLEAVSVDQGYNMIRLLGG